MSKKPKTPPAPIRRWLSRKEVAFRLGVSTRTIANYQERGMLNPTYINQRIVRYSEAEVDALIDNNRIIPQNS